MDAQFVAIAQEVQGRDMVAGRVAIHGLIADATDYVNTLNNTAPSLDQLRALRIVLNDSIIKNRGGLQTLLDVQTWMTLFDPNKHSQIWSTMQHHLFLFPDGPVAARLAAKSTSSTTG